jgi:hypothetical protein
MPRKSPEPRSLPQQIRDAVASDEFSKARLLWEEYGELFRADILRGPVPQSRLAEARELAEWTRMAALCARARMRDRLNQIAVAQKYGWPAERRGSTLAARF